MKTGGRFLLLHHHLLHLLLHPLHVVVVALLLVVCCGGWVLGGAHAVRVAGDTRPNLVFVFPDTLRAESFNQYNPAVKKLNVTPFTEEFFNDGTTFQSAHVMHTQCSPSRCTMFSGRYMHVLGHRTQTHLIQDYECVMEAPSPVPCVCFLCRCVGRSQTSVRARGTHTRKQSCQLAACLPVCGACRMPRRSTFLAAMYCPCTIGWSGVRMRFTALHCTALHHVVLL
eukprot:INCI17580.6.p1 GENE.INCI17580.6~~INCI17580.6.p1  ORF type:complete len:226 (-),score=19.37 INCI17580.6:24-701(-)